MDTHLIPNDARIYVAGHTGLVGAALMRTLQAKGYTNLLTATHHVLDLRHQRDVRDWFAANRPEYVFLVAGTVGGILANSTRPAEFIYDNLMIAANVIDCAYQYDTKKLLYVGSSCIYPRACHQPIEEKDLLTGPLEPTNDAYAIAKIAGIRMCRAYRQQYVCNFISAMPTNLYGPGDNFSLTEGHVMPMLMRRFHEAKLAGDKELTVWGTGIPLREFLHVTDLAEALLFLMEHYDDDEHINVGTGEDVTIEQMARLLRDVIYPGASLTFDRSKPDGVFRKLLDVSKLRSLGWKHRIGLLDGICNTYSWYKENQLCVRR